MISAGDIGHRVVVRRMVVGGLTDVLGELVSYDDRRLVVRRRDSSLVGIDVATVVAARRVPSGRVRIRTARFADAEPIELLRRASWRAAYRGMVPDAFLDAMSINVPRRAGLLRDPQPGVVTVVAESDDALVGFAVGGHTRDADLSPDVGEVYACYVHPDWWAGGVGGRLLRRLLDMLRADGRHPATLWVLEANDRARRFYAGHGFAPDGARQTTDLGAPVIEVRYRRS